MVAGAGFLDSITVLCWVALCFRSWTLCATPRRFKWRTYGHVHAASARKALLTFSHSHGRVLRLASLASNPKKLITILCNNSRSKVTACLFCPLKPHFLFTCVLARVKSRSVRVRKCENQSLARPAKLNLQPAIDR